MLNAQHLGELCYFLTWSDFSDTAQQSISGYRKKQLDSSVITVFAGKWDGITME